MSMIKAFHKIASLSGRMRRRTACARLRRGLLLSVLLLFLPAAALAQTPVITVGSDSGLPTPLVRGLPPPS